MRLWNTLHTLYRGKNSVRHGEGPRARLEVEALDQRLLPSPLSSFQWGIGRGISSSYDLPTHEAGSRSLVASYQHSRVIEIVITKPTDSAGSRHAKPSAGTSRLPMDQFSINFARPMMSFSWGEVNSPD